MGKASNWEINKIGKDERYVATFMKWRLGREDRQRMSVTIWSNEEDALKAWSKVGWEEVQCQNRVEDVREAVEWRKGDSQFPPKHDVQ